MPDLPQRIREELEALDKLRDEDIDYSDIPQITDWSNAVRGRFYRPSSRQPILRAYFDGSGSVGDPNNALLTLAGHVATPSEWEHFSTQWSAVLDRWEVPYLHMKELHNPKLTSPYRGWNDARRRGFLRDVHNTAFAERWGKADLEAFTHLSCSVSLQDYEKAQPLCGSPLQKGPEAFCVDRVVAAALGRLPEDPTAPTGRAGALELYFDRGERFMKHIVGAWQQCRTDRNSPLSLITRIDAVDMRDAPGIQAADYIAWLANKDVRDNNMAARLRRLFAGPGFSTVYNYGRLIESYGTAMEQDART